MPALADELKMSGPFTLVEEEASLSILRTADVLQDRVSGVLKKFDLTPTQYNVLRILKGSPDGLCCREISDRLISRDPDVTRLLDRMESRQWVVRERSSTDRRVVLVRITKEGVRLLVQIDPFVAAYHRQQFCGWREKQVRQLILFLQQIRDEKLKTEKGDL